jgi:hypothetical protein
MLFLQLLSQAFQFDLRRLDLSLLLLGSVRKHDERAFWHPDAQPRISSHGICNMTLFMLQNAVTDALPIQGIGHSNLRHDVSVAVTSNRIGLRVRRNTR